MRAREARSSGMNYAEQDATYASLRARYAFSLAKTGEKLQRLAIIISIIIDQVHFFGVFRPLIRLLPLSPSPHSIGDKRDAR